MVEGGLNLDRHVRKVTRTTKGRPLYQRQTALGHRHLASNKTSLDMLETEE